MENVSKQTLPCESCGRPCNPEDLKPATWDENLKVGPCCPISYDLPELENAPTCPTLWESVYRCKSVLEVAAAMDEHLIYCPVCSEKRKKMLSEIPSRDGGMEKAA